MIKSFLVLAVLSLLAKSPPAFAESATWALNPLSGDWNARSNWTPNLVPNGATDVATFGVSNTTAVNLSTSLTLDSIVFSPGASRYTIAGAASRTATSLTLSGAGIVNNSGLPQNFVVYSVPSDLIIFTGTATAGAQTVFTNQAGGRAGQTPGEQFMDNSSADHATFITNGSSSRTFGAQGQVQFTGSSTAGYATFINGPGALAGGFTGFYDLSTAGNATFICNGGTAIQPYGGAIALSTTSDGGQAVFTANGTDVAGAQGGTISIIFSASAGNATMIANGGLVDGGLISFATTSSGGNARIEVFGNGTLDVSFPNGTFSTIGSLEGDGLVYLGGDNLMIGGNSLSTTFSGMIADGGPYGGAGASLTLVSGTSLELSGANTYTGGTSIENGTLIVSNTTASATGSGQVQVVTGMLGGGGIISGAAVIGLGGGTGAFLAPAHGTKLPATLTVQSLLIFNSDSSYTYTFKAQKSKTKSDTVIANGVTINPGAILNLSGQAQDLPQGLVLTVISNTSAAPISGTFSNLADGAIVVVNGQNLQANYEGGDGNDLTLTVVL